MNTKQFLLTVYLLLTVLWAGVAGFAVNEGLQAQTALEYPEKAEACYNAMGGEGELPKTAIDNKASIDGLYAILALFISGVSLAYVVKYTAELTEEDDEE